MNRQQGKLLITLHVSQVRNIALVLAPITFALGSDGKNILSGREVS